VKQIRAKFEKSDIAALPKVLFEGRIIVILSEREADRAVDYLLRQPILGFDTETRPSFRRGQMHKVALLQVSTRDTAFLFRLNRIGLTDSIVRLLEDKRVLKVGLSLKDDMHNLRLRRDFQPGTFVELQQEVQRLGVEDMSLQKLYANLLGGRISKTQQLTNWEADVLTEAQQRYAATDAWACIQIHREIERLLQTGDYQLIE
jgi:ribonuclease D